MYKERYAEIRDQIVDTVTKAIKEYDTEEYRTLLDYEKNR